MADSKDNAPRRKTFDELKKSINERADAAQRVAASLVP